MYQEDPKFKDQIDKIQADYNAGKMIPIPVYKPNSFIFDHYIYAFKIGGAGTLKKDTPKPGDASWKAGLARVERAIQNVKNGTATLYEQSLTSEFRFGDCQGDPACQQSQNAFAHWDDEQFLTEMYSNPEILSEFWALMKALDIFNRMRDGEEKEKLREFLCTRLPKLWICEGGEFELSIEQLPNILQEAPEGMPEPLMNELRQVNDAYESALLEYETDGDEGKLMERIAELDELAQDLIKRYITERSRVTRLIDPNSEPEEELIILATQILDLYTKAESTKKAFKERRIKRGEYLSRLVEIESEIKKLMKQFRELIKDSYILPDDVWEHGTNRALKFDWVKRIVEDINGSRDLAKLKIVLKIYEKVYRDIAEIFIRSEIWRNSREVEELRKNRRRR